MKIAIMSLLVISTIVGVVAAGMKSSKFRTQLVAVAKGDPT